MALDGAAWVEAGAPAAMVVARAKAPCPIVALVATETVEIAEVAMETVAATEIAVGVPAVAMEIAAVVLVVSGVQWVPAPTILVAVVRAVIVALISDPRIAAGNHR